MKKCPAGDNSTMSNLNNRHKNNVSFGNRLEEAIPVFCVAKRGAAVKLDKDYAALMLIEILYERKLINRETTGCPGEAR